MVIIREERSLTGKDGGQRQLAVSLVKMLDTEQKKTGERGEYIKVQFCRGLLQEKNSMAEKMRFAFYATAPGGFRYA